MEKISGATSNDGNSRISDEIEKSLQDWKLPPLSSSNVYKESGVFNIFSCCKVKTVEEEIPFSEKFATFNLLSRNLINGHPEDFKYLHIGMVQVGLKPRKLGSNLSATISLRHKDCRCFNESVWGMVESSLCNGPIYFTYFPPPQYSSSASGLSAGICIDVNIEGSSLVGGDHESMILMYRFHYKVMNKSYLPRMRTLCSRGADEEGKTTLFLTDIAQNNRVVSKKIVWDEVAVPARWMVGCSGGGSSAFETFVEWEETAESLVLKAWNRVELKREEVSVEVENGGILRLRVEKGQRDTLCRRFRLPENARLDQLTAAMDNNMLMVTVPKERDELNGGVKSIDIISG